MSDPIIKEEHLHFLDRLRASGRTNMYGAGDYLQREFSVDKHDASFILQHWMNTFGDRKERGETVA